jgi:hypothetical protein
VPFADARALEDPLVARLDHLLEIGVRQEARRDVGREPGDFHGSQVPDAGGQTGGVSYHSLSL